MKTKTRICIALVAILLALPMGGCAKYWERQEANGGIFSTSTANYVVVKYSGGRIVDVWKLENVFVQSEQNSDGWLFPDKNRNPIHIGGDMKSIRFNNQSDIWTKYHEWHLDIDGGEYRPSA